MLQLPANQRQVLHGEIVFDEPPGQPSVVSLLDFLSFLMDRLVQVPGTRLRVGLNSLFLVVPVLGDIIPTAISVAILAIGLSSYHVPRIVAARMVLNALLDAALGWIPVFGDLFDLFFKADTRNVRLLQEYAGRGAEPPRSTWRHWVFVVGLLGFFALLLVLLVLGAISLIHWLANAIK